ncbi:DUF559 domain-containing protein [Paenibacillus silviterrae]|uniref:DUF559 domain-containing protein n=1 Tax=Paenibacillus silviterrae TaxID=3242194 RepID=UPI0025439573|nr:DUF559 domain-containing protein [Paenibacillus chinjuensis]
MTFEEAHAAFILHHVERRTGERKGRLVRGHNEAERLFCRNVWWPVRGSFDDLHPEYEVRDWRGMSYFCDFVWLTQPVKLVIEIKGFGPHVRDMDRQKYCSELNRETFLTAMGYQVISFAYDDVSQRPEVCTTLLRMVLSRYQAEPGPTGRLAVLEKEVIRLACRLSRPLRTVDVREHLLLNHRTAVRVLQALCGKGWLVPKEGPTAKYIVGYELQRGAWRSL